MNELDAAAEVLHQTEDMALDPATLSSPVLERLIAEVRQERAGIKVAAYNRTHNRHNRGR